MQMLRSVPETALLPRFSILEVRASGVSGDVVSAPSSTNWICKSSQKFLRTQRKTSPIFHLSVFIYKQQVQYLWLAYKYPMVLLTEEISFALHSPIVLAFGLIQNDSHPFSRSEEGVSDVSHGASVTFTDDFYQRANLNRTPTSIWTHSAAAAARRLEQEKQ